MSNSKNSTKKMFSPDWKSVGAGVVAGMILLALIIGAGGRLEKVNLFGADIVFPTQTSVSLEKQDDLLLDEIPFWVFSYGFGKDFIPPQHFSSLSIVNERDGDKDYKIAFSMPLQGDAAVGISFTLADPIDLTNYTYIEFSSHFTNSQCDLFLKDTDTAGAFVTISDKSPASIRTDLVNGKWQFKIALSNFTGINIKSVKEIGCNAHRCEGECSFELSEIRFSRP